MALYLKGTCRFYSAFTLIIFTLLSNVSYSQITVTGHITYQNDNAPAAFANVELANKSAATMADPSGNFKLHIPKEQQSDTVVISSVGYESIKVPLKTALKRNDYKLREKVEVLETVTVFNVHQSVGSLSQTVGYFRSWHFEKTGGEIGRIFQLPYKQYKIDKVRFKVANLCDTCLLRVHIREVKDGKPGNEIVSDSISLFINRLTLDDKPSEFDLIPYDFTFHQDELFVSIEVLGCSSAKKEFCSFSFAGTDKGEYIYKSKANTDWKTTDDYTIYLKLFLRY